jgi:hypothetical protein
MKLADQLSKLPISRSGDRAPRFQVNGHATLTMQESSLRLEGEMQNISRTGILMIFSGHVQRPLEPGETVQLMLEPIPKLFEVPIICRATVARMDKIQLEDRVIWHVGLHFEQ